MNLNNKNKNIISPVKNFNYQKKIISKIEIFQKTQFRVAMQKNGELTNFSIPIISKLLNISLDSCFKGQRTLVNISTDKQIGIFFTKNTDLCYMVEKGFVDMAVVGTDSISEYKKTNKFKIIKSLKKLIKWPLVIATPYNSKMQKLKDFKVVATQYPKLTGRLFKKMNLKRIKIISLNGSCEASPYLLKKVSGIVDLSVTGKTLIENGLRSWFPPLDYIYPVIIANINSLQKVSKKKFFQKVVNS